MEIIMKKMALAAALAVSFSGAAFAAEETAAAGSSTGTAAGTGASAVAAGTATTHQAVFHLPVELLGPQVEIAADPPCRCTRKADP